MSLSSSSPESARAGRGLLWAVLFIVAAAGLAAAVMAPVGRGAPVGTAHPEAPAFRLDDLRDPTRSIELADYEGTPVVINFFAAWCVPCRTELPVLEAASVAYGGRVRFLGIDHADVREDALDLLERTKVTFPVASDPEGAVAERFGSRGLPSTAFVDARGRLIGVARGALSAVELESWVARLRTDGTG